MQSLLFTLLFYIWIVGFIVPSTSFVYKYMSVSKYHYIYIYMYIYTVVQQVLKCNYHYLCYIMDEKAAKFEIKGSNPKVSSCIITIINIMVAIL